MHPRFHTSAKAVIVRGGSILLVEYRDVAAGEVGVHYNLPGGRVQQDETLRQAVARKALEETGALVEVGRLMLVYEYIGNNHENILGCKHSISLVFCCALRKDSPEPCLRAATQPDTIQTDVKWIPLKSLGQVVLWPDIRGLLGGILEGSAELSDLYIGDIV